MKRLLVPLLIVVLAASALAGCGGDGGEEGGGQEGLLKAPYLAKLNVDMASFLGTLQELKASATNAVAGNVDQAAFDSISASVGKLVAKYEAMTPPAELQSLHDRWLATLRETKLAATDLKNKQYTAATKKIDEVKGKFDLIKGELESP